MLDRIRQLHGKDLDLPTYRTDFFAALDTAVGIVWKLERHQEFREPGDPSWEAFMAGDWPRALELNEAERPQVRAQIADDHVRGREVRRLRIVESPVSPYLQWEMQYLRLLAEEGERYRVLDAGAVRDREARHGRLPEVVVIGGSVLYEVAYSADGTPAGGRRFDAPAVVTGAARDLAGLYALGEPLLSYFERAVAPLPPPRLDSHG